MNKISKYLVVGLAAIFLLTEKANANPAGSGKSVPALPLPIAPEFRVSKDVAGRAASLGEDNLHYGAEPRDSE